MIALLEEWIAEGALRRDGDGNGDYDRSAAVAIMDAWWEPLLRGIFDPVLGDSARIPITFDNAPSSGGSAYESGFYPHVYTDLSMVLGRRLKSPTSRIYCGGSKEASGNRDACAKVVLDSLVAAGDALRDSQDTDDPGAWRSDAAARADPVPAGRGSLDALGEPADHSADRHVRPAAGAAEAAAEGALRGRPGARRVSSGPTARASCA